MTDKMKKLGKNYIKPVEVETGDILQIIAKPILRTLDKDTKKQRERYEIELQGIKTFNLDKKWRIATFNTTSSDACLDAFGDNPDDWVNRMVKVEKKLENVMGDQKEVLYFHPYLNPQVELPKPEPTVKPATLRTVDLTQCTPEQQAAIQEIMQKKGVSATS
jgi:hypothetical protein